jgi:hypothetical protein
MASKQSKRTSYSELLETVTKKMLKKAFTEKSCKAMSREEVSRIEKILLLFGKDHAWNPANWVLAQLGAQLTTNSRSKSKSGSGSSSSAQLPARHIIAADFSGFGVASAGVDDPFVWDSDHIRAVAIALAARILPLRPQCVGNYRWSDDVFFAASATTTAGPTSDFRSDRSMSMAANNRTTTTGKSKAANIAVNTTSTTTSFSTSTTTSFSGSGWSEFTQWSAANPTVRPDRFAHIARPTNTGNSSSSGGSGTSRDGVVMVDLGDYLDAQADLQAIRPPVKLPHELSCNFTSTLIPEAAMTLLAKESLGLYQYLDVTLGLVLTKGYLQRVKWLDKKGLLNQRQGSGTVAGSTASSPASSSSSSFASPSSSSSSCVNRANQSTAASEAALQLSPNPLITGVRPVFEVPSN